MKRASYSSFLFVVPLAVASAAACGGNAASIGDSEHKGGPGSQPVPACAGTSDCATGEVCLFAVGSCAATGQCLSLESLGSTCDHVVAYCGCNGESVAGVCGPSYAYGATLGETAPCGPAATTPGGATLGTLAQDSTTAPENLAADGTNVYVANLGAGTVTQISVHDGVTTTLGTNQDQPFAIATNGSRVFWTNEGGGGDGAVMMGYVGALSPVVLASGQSNPAALAIDVANVYWVTIGDSKAVMTVPIAGGTPTTLAAATDPWAIAADGTTVYFTDGDSILSVPSTGGTPTTLAIDQPFPFDLAVDGTTLYWSTARGAGAILSMPKAGGTPKTLTSATGTARIAIDATTLYFTSPGDDPNDGIVASIPLAGGVAPTVLATGQSSPEGIVVDTTRAYWVETGSGAVVELSPK